MTVPMYILSVFVIVLSNTNFLTFVDSKLPVKQQAPKDTPPRIQIRAILIRCPQHIIPDNNVRGGKPDDDKVISVLRTDDIMRFSGFDKDELLMHSEVKNCKRKMIITMMINNLGRTVTEEEFVVVDHVYDPDLHKRSRLLNPFVFKIKQDVVLQLYGMRYIQSVNAMAREEVLNKGMSNFTGCDTTSSSPTCGMIYHDNRIVPYSEGFCCSCDSYVNLQRQPGLSATRQQKMFSNRKDNHFVEKNDLNDGDKYFNEKFKRDVDEEKDYPQKRSDNLDLLRSKYMSGDFDFAKNGFYTPQIVRRNHLSENLNKLTSFEEASSWEHKSRFEDVVADKGNKILLNKENFEQILDEEGMSDNDDEKKKRRSVDSEPKHSLNGDEREIVDEGDEKKKLRNVDGELASLNNDEQEIIDKYYERKKHPVVDGECNRGLNDDEKEMFDKDSVKKNRRDVDGVTEQNLNDNRSEIADKNGGIKERQDVDGKSKLKLDEEDAHQDVYGEREMSLKNDDKKVIADKDCEKRKERSMHDETESLRGLRVLEQKPFLLKPRDWTSFQALKLKLKGLKPVSPQFKTSYQPSHRYVKVMEENRPDLERARGFQMSDYRPRWSTNSKTTFKKPTPWEIIPHTCSTDKRNKSIVRVLTKLKDERCYPDPVYVDVDKSELFDNFMKNFERKSVRNSRSNLDDIEQPATNNSLLYDDSINNTNANQCEEAWSKLQTLLLEQAIDERLCSVENGTRNELDFTCNKEDKKIIDRLKRQVNRWLDDNYEFDLSNVYNSSSRYGNNELLQLKNTDDHSYFVNSAQNLESPYGLNRYSFNTHNKGEVFGQQDPVFDSSRQLDDFQFSSENANLSEFGGKSITTLGLLPYSQVEKLKPVITNEFSENYVSNLGERSKMYDQNINRNSMLWKKNENFAFKYPELPLGETIDGRNYEDSTLKNAAEEISDFNKYYSKPPIHFHSDAGPVFIDEMKYSPPLDAHLRLSQVTPNSNSPLSNDPNSIQPLNINEIGDIQSRMLMVPEKSDNSLQGQRMLSPFRSEPEEENRDKLEKYLDENAQKMKDEQSENLSGDPWNLKEKYDLGLKPLDERNSFLNVESKSNMHKPDDFTNFNLINNANQNGRVDVDFGNKLGYDRNLGKVDNENADGLSANDGMMFDDMPFNKNLAFNGSNLLRSLSPQSFHVYKQEMDSPYIINTSHAKHKPNFQLPESNREDANKRFRVLEAATEFGKPSILEPYEVEKLMQKAMNSGYENSTPSASQEFSTDSNSVPVLVPENASSMSTGSKPAPILISGNVSNIYGKKGKLIFIPDDLEEPTPHKKQPDDDPRKYLENYKPINIKSKMYLPNSESNLSYPNLTNSGECITGKPGFEISDFGKTNTNSKMVLPSFLKNWSGNQERNILETNLPTDEKSGSLYNTHNVNFLQRKHFDNSPIKSCNVDDSNPLTNIEHKFLTNNVDAPSEITNKNDQKRIFEKDMIEKRDTEQLKSMTKKNSKKVRRQVSSNGNQIRGGQNCIDRYVPPGANPITYHESAHCLRFSDLWYSVYTLKKPNLDHSLQLHLYEKANFPHATHWEELTRGITTDLGTTNRHIEDGISTLSFTYIPLMDLMSGDFCLDEHKATLLVPESLPPNLAAKYPQLSGSPNEYLLVQSDDISLEGDECNKVGTSFEGFATQGDRCAQPRGTCLHNQPVDMWTHDVMARDEGKPGKFFLENFAVVAEQPLLVNHSSQEQSLALEYYRHFSTIIEVEVRSDLNAIVRTGEFGQLTEVYVDSTCHSNTKLTVVVTNQGLASSAYYPKLSNCPVELPEVWTHNVGPLVMIAPQHRHVYQMTMYGVLPVDRFYCSVELMNDKKELVSTRRVRIQKHDRCMCVWHCLCACSASTEGLSCDPMSLQHYHAAGFQGSLPVNNLHPETKSERVVKILMPIAIVVAFSLLLGFLKAVFGLCCAIVGAYGLWALCKSRSKKLPSYKENDLQDYSVIYDGEGYAIHPTQQTRNIKLFDKLAEFFINVFFVFLLLWSAIVLLLCCAFRSEEGDDNVDDESSYETDDENDDEDNKAQGTGTDEETMEDESVVVNSVIEERRRCERDVQV